ncbi:SDR family oxidoreductase [Curtobacterium sp. B18]|uniref:SDR family oxidoreductase n=1 Tax=Curtobacterium sp. B18 TaxID=95614 RepID=UPI000347494D
MIEEFAAPSDDDVMAPIRAVHPMGRVDDADEVSRAILYLASDAASFTAGASISVVAVRTVQQDPSRFGSP